MNLCLISSTFPLPGESPTIGPDNVVFNLAKELVKLDVDLFIEIITIRSDINKPFSDEFFPNVVVHYYPSFKLIPRSLGDPIIIKRVINEFKFDLIHSHYSIALSKILDLDTPKVVTLHEILWGEKTTTTSLIIKIGYYDYNIYLLKKVLLKINTLVAISPYVIDELRSKTLDKNLTIYQINNPIEKSYFSLLKKDEGYTLFYPAFLNERKNQIAAVYAIKSIVEKRLIGEKVKDLKLILTGGCDKKYLKKITSLINKTNLNDIIYYRGKVSRDEIKELYSKASIVYLFSKQETQPMAILEAMATGTPVIASNIKSNSYLIKQGVNGYLVDPEDINKIVEYTIELLENEEKRRIMGQNAKMIAENMYSSDTIALKTINMYQNILGQNKN